MGLSGKQNRFIEEYLFDFNATQAAIRAGYSPKTARVQASQNLTKLNIRSKIKEALSLREQRLLYDSYWVAESLKEILEEAMLNKDHHAALKALHLLGKHIGMFSGRVKPNDISKQIQPIQIHITQMMKRDLGS